MKERLQKLSELSKRIAEASYRRFIPVLLLIALALNVIVEALARNSIFGVFSHLFSSPLVFFVNFLIIFLTLTPCLLIKKRIPYITFLFAVWLGIGIGNAVVLTNRTNPLSAIDFLVLKSVFTMLPIYFDIIEIVLILGLIGFAVAFVVLLFIKFPKSKVVWHKSVGCIALAAVAIWLGSTIIYADMKNSPATDELSDTYEKYGFAYCFSRSLFAHGVDKPDGYTPDKVDEIIDSVTDGNGNGEISSQPNIIFVQLESFFDPNHVIGATYSSDPAPNFNRLKKEGVSGYLGMTSVGGGTANTEFEILTGMNLEHFGFGEYPYTTVLKARACESIAANLKTVGYSAHAMHNHIADFYDRDIAYSSLGFDSFTSIEMMRDIVRNPLGWAKDEILEQEIIAALDSTDTPDFVFAVSVQGHGKYPDEQIENEGAEDGGYENLGDIVTSGGKNAIEVFGIDDESIRNQFTYYVNQIYEMDLFIGKLVSALENRHEESIVVFYGDHMPTLPLTDNDVTNGDIYETEYAVWSSFKIGAAETNDLNSLDRDMEAYMLSAYIQKLCGMSIGNITKLHQSELLNGKNKDEYLRMLEYSQLYDENGGEYTRSDMKWGIRPIVVSSYKMSGNTLYVSGEGFNEYSTVVVDGLKRGTTYINQHTLAVENVFFQVDRIEVVQSASGIGEIYKATLEE